MQVFFIILLIFFAIFGITDITKYIAKSFFRSEKTQISNCDEAEYIIRSLAMSHKWPEFEKQSCLVCRYSSDKKEIEKIIEISVNDFDFIEFEKNKS